MAKQPVHSFPDRKSANKAFFKFYFQSSIYVGYNTLLNLLFTYFFWYSHITDPGREKYHFFFTLRDSPADFINVNCWGTENYIENLSKSFRINDIGELEKDSIDDYLVK